MRLDDDLKYFEEPGFKKILERYEQARAAGQNVYMDAEDLTDVAEYYALVLQDNEQADEAINLALLLHPDAVDPQIFKARQFMLANEPDKALEICNAIDDQGHREVLFLRAELMVRDDNCEDASDLLLRSAEAQSEDVDYFLYDSAYIFIDYSQYDWALVFANRLADMAPDWYKTWQLQADVQLGMGNNRVALKYVGRMLDVDPFSIETWNWSAEAHSNLGQYTQAMESVEYALAIEPENERALQLKAWILLQQGNCAEAHEIYQRLETVNPTCENHWMYDSYALLDLNQPEQAYRAVKQAEELAGDDSEDKAAIFEQVAQSASRLGNVNEALEYLGKAESVKAGEKKNEWDERMLAVRVFAENDSLDEALKAIHALMERYPDAALDIYYQGASVLFDYSYFDTVVAMLTELLQLSDEVHPDAYAMLAFSQMSLGNHDEALTNIRKAIDAHAPSLADIFCDKFPGVKPEEIYDYYYYQVYGQWPETR